MRCLLISFGVQAIRQAAEVNQRTLVDSAANLLRFVARADREDDPSTLCAAPGFRSTWV